MGIDRPTQAVGFAKTAAERGNEGDRVVVVMFTAETSFHGRWNDHSGGVRLVIGSVRDAPGMAGSMMWNLSEGSVEVKAKSLICQRNTSENWHESWTRY